MKKLLTIFFAIIFIFQLHSQEKPKLLMPLLHTAKVKKLLFSPNNKLLLSISYDNTIKIWDVKTGLNITTFKNHKYNILDAEFMTDEIIASFSQDGKLMVWPIDNKILREEKILNFNERRISSADISFDSKYLLVATNFRGGSYGQEIVLWDIKNNKEISQKKRDNFKRFGKHNESNHDNTIDEILITKNSKDFFYTGSHLIRKSLVSRKFKKNYTDEIFNESLSTTGRILLTNRPSSLSINNNFLLAQYYGELKLIDLNTDKLKKIYKNFSNSKTTTSAISNNRDFVCAGTADGQVFLWDNQENIKYKLDFNDDNSITSLAFSQNDKYLAVSYNSNIRIFSTITKKLTQDFSNASNEISIVDNSFQNNTLSILDNKKEIIKTFDFSTLKLEDSYHLIRYNKNPINKISLINNNSCVIATDSTLSWGEKNDIDGKIWNIKSNIKLSKYLTSIQIKEYNKNRNKIPYISPSNDFIIFNSFLYVTLPKFTGNEKYWEGGKMFEILDYERQISLDNLLFKDEKKFFDVSIGYINDSKFANILLSEKRLWNKYISCIDYNDSYSFMIGATYDASTYLMNKFRTFGTVTNWFDIGKPVETEFVFWNIKDNKVGKTFKINKISYVTSIKFPKYTSNFTFYTGHFNGSLYNWDINDEKIIFKYNGHQRKIKQIYEPIPESLYSPHLFFTSSTDNTIKLWDSKNTEELATLHLLNNNDFFIQTNDGYFAGNKNFTKKIGYRINGSVYPFEQFDLKFNRPDIILKRLGFANENTVKLYNKAYLKRLEKYGFTENMLNNDFHIPNIYILNYDNLALETQEKMYEFTVMAQDSKYNLNRINVWVNNVPVFGIKGIDVKIKKLNKITQKISIVLNKGKNKIQVSTYNQKAVESYKETFYVNYVPKHNTKPNLYIVTIGVSKYEDDNYNLEYPSKDAKDLSNVFINKSDVFNKVNTISLLDEDVTIKNIKSIKNKLQETKVDDVVIVFYTGHGIISDNLDYYLGTYDIDFDNPSIKGLPFEEIELLLDGIPARKKILMVDACHSGEIDKNNNTNVITKKITSNNEHIRFSGIEKGDSNISINLQNSFELMKELFEDLRRGTGATIISASSGGEFAYESNVLQNGVFTYSILKALTTPIADKNKDGKVQVSELRNFVQDNVYKLTNGQQKPTNRRENIECDFIINNIK